MLELMCERAVVRDVELERRDLVLCDGCWTAPDKARAMPEVADGLAIGAEDWRHAAAFAVMSTALNGRESETKALLENLGGSAAPTGAEWMRTLDRVAQRVQSGQIDASWDGFLTSVLEVLPWDLVREPSRGTEDALASARFLPDQDGRLISADDSARVFFQPVVGIDDAAELVDTVPSSLKERIAFIHGDVRTHEEGARRRSTEVHKFLDGRFARGFRREEIVRDVILAALPPMPAPLGSADAALCAELLGWTLGLLGEDPSDALLALLQNLPLACHGGWRPAQETSFGPGWPRTAGEDLWVLCEELGGDAAERLREAAVLDPGDPRWGLDVDGQGGLFARIGVADGLRLRRVDDMRFRMAQYDYELPQAAPTGVDGAAWAGWRTAVLPEAEPSHIGWFDYSLERVFHLPELYGCADLSQRGRRAFSRLVVDSMRGWPGGWEEVTIRKVAGEWRRWSITSPLKHWLNTMAWLADGGTAERALPNRWLVPTSLLRGHSERFHHLRPLSLELSRRLDTDAELRAGLERLGLNVYPTDGDRIGPELLDALADAWLTQRVVPGRFDIFLGQLRHAWQHLDQGRGLPKMFLIRTARRGFDVLDGDGLRDVYLVDDPDKGRSLREGGTRILEMELREANQLAGILVDTTGVRRASELVERVLIDGVEWAGPRMACRPWRIRGTAGCPLRC